jgi:hypothetical protein
MAHRLCQEWRVELIEPRRVKFLFFMLPEVKEAARKAAREDNRSLSSYIETTLIEVLTKRGLLDLRAGSGSSGK